MFVVLLLKAGHSLCVEKSVWSSHRLGYDDNVVFTEFIAEIWDKKNKGSAQWTSCKQVNRLF